MTYWVSDVTTLRLRIRHTCSIDGVDQVTCEILRDSEPFLVLAEPLFAPIELEPSYWASEGPPDLTDWPDGGVTSSSNWLGFGPSATEWLNGVQPWAAPTLTRTCPPVGHDLGRASADHLESDARVKRTHRRDICPYAVVMTRIGQLDLRSTNGGRHVNKLPTTHANSHGRYL